MGEVIRSAIRPHNNPWRSARDLGGIWQFRLDAGDVGVAAGWGGGLDPAATHAIAVPGSWNEQLAELGAMNHVGPAWYQSEFHTPALAAGEVAELRFGSADYFADVWIDGTAVGSSSAAMLPFTVPVAVGPCPAKLRQLVVRVSNLLPENGPMQRVSKADYPAEGRPRDEYLPAVRFDFFPYGGINRPVHLVVRPAVAIADYRVVTRQNGADWTAEVAITATGGAACQLSLTTPDGSIAASGTAALAGGAGTVTLAVPGGRPWSPADPYLYRLDLTLADPAGQAIDGVSQRLGLREIAVVGTELRLNGQPLTLTGCGKHEDSPIHGRGLNLPQLVKDFGLLKWLGANSVRTSHYPYAEEFLDMADAHGILVIDELFCVNLDFRKVDAATLAAHQREAGELIARDANRTCVIAWSLANEPGYLAEREYQASGPYWTALFAHARALDPTRPLTHANVGYAGNADPAFDHGDFLMINRYHGWYSDPAQLDLATAKLRADLDAIAAYGKPILISEFGADALAGQHSTTPQLFTEEYQADFIAAYWREIAAHPACIGGHIWAFADFRTAQHGRRVVYNLKGLFTRTREPKAAAFTARRLWGAA